jgi:hypothetical protein
MKPAGGADVLSFKTNRNIMSTNKFHTAAIFAAALIAGTGALAQTTSSAPAPASNEINYVSQLPSASQLSKAQPPAGARIAKITQTSGAITVTYVYGNGQAQVVSYRLLAEAAGTPAPAPASPVQTLQSTTAGQPTTVVQPTTPAPVYYYDAPPAVVYQSVPAVYYDSPAYYPYPWYPAVSVGLGFGYRGYGFGGYGFRGGFHGGFRR